MVQIGMQIFEYKSPFKEKNRNMYSLSENSIFYSLEMRSKCTVLFLHIKIVNKIFNPYLKILNAYKKKKSMNFDKAKYKS